ncbi:unnamed protein product [Acanthoscelides obtectus]|uniref:Uncharacterized protein n=1 Tax=Acanthoscelides obtectus TaxID=200917 RepID=A0A9P0K2H6_ACAOB|nr:unnamed protein product [Acanthoscelides obtectus]CAH2010366.1 unnamed protein product [Acanthoscelides obtectus]CAK1630797.1 hypothetical protein AOBTE_LOCUS6557 [Acanthoscelides obtectus]CAK1647021.1 hypothetical protein AOBTE_LOCUS15006 [Acanthoscelides obtectus]
MCSIILFLMSMSLDDCNSRRPPRFSFSSTLVVLFNFFIAVLQTFSLIPRVPRNIFLQTNCRIPSRGKKK